MIASLSDAMVVIREDEAEMKRLRAEIERLRAIVDKLAKTGDGVIAELGMTVYGCIDGRVERLIIVSIREDEIIADSINGTWAFNQRGLCCYSTLAAAEAAKET